MSFLVDEFRIYLSENVQVFYRCSYFSLKCSAQRGLYHEEFWMFRANECVSIEDEFIDSSQCECDVSRYNYIKRMGSQFGSVGVNFVTGPSYNSLYSLNSQLSFEIVEQWSSLPSKS